MTGDIPAYAQTGSMIDKQQQNDRCAQAYKEIDGLVRLEDIDDHYDEHQQTGIHIICEEALEDVVLVVEQLQLHFPFGRHDLTSKFALELVNASQIFIRLLVVAVSSRGDNSPSVEWYDVADI